MAAANQLLCWATETGKAVQLTAVVRKKATKRHQAQSTLTLASTRPPS